MSVIVLPPMPRLTRFTMRKVYSASAPQRPAFGRATAGISRMGDHWSVEVDPGALALEQGLAFIADVIEGRRTALRIPQLDVDTGALGLTIVDGAGQSGESLNVRGFEAQAVVRKGWFLSIIHAGERSTHQARAEAVAGADHRVTLSIWPMLSRPYADGDAVEIVEPWIEGVLTKGGDFDVSRPASAKPDAFVIEE